METLPLSNAPKSSFSSNVIDKDVQAIFYPLNVMSVLLLHPKYVIKNNKITPLSNVIKIFSACVTTLYLCQHAHKFFSVVLDDNIRRIQPVSYLYYATGSDLLFLTWGFIMNCAGNIIYTKKYVAFILKFQESHRFLGSACFKRFIIVNWLSIISMFGYFISSCIYTYFTFFHPPWGTLFHMMVLATLDADAVYACRLILLISEQFIQWNERALLLKENGEDKDYCRKMFQTYAQILKCYKIYRNTMQFMILYKTAESIIIGLVDIQILITFVKLVVKEKKPLYVQILVYAWTIKNLAIQTTLSVHLETFYGIANKVQDSCALLLASNCTEESKKLCKKVLRLHRTTFEKLNVFGLFVVESRHGLRLLALFTSYTVVLLQFAFL